MFYGISPSKVKVKQDKIVFTGMFGTTRQLNNFIDIRLSDTLPVISRRLNGLSVGGINKGRFSLVNGSSCMMYLASDDSPYIVFKEKNGKEIYYNTRLPEETNRIYNQLLLLFSSK